MVGTRVKPYSRGLSAHSKATDSWGVVGTDWAEDVWGKVVTLRGPIAAMI